MLDSSFTIKNFVKNMIKYIFKPLYVVIECITLIVNKMLLSIKQMNI